MKKIFALVVLLVMAFSLLGLTGCSEHASSFRAVYLAEHNDRDSAGISFGHLKGKYVIKLKNTKSDAKLKYDGEIGKGDVTVYYEVNGDKKELFSLNSNESESSEVEVGKGTVYIYIECEEDCDDGSFDFELR